MQRVTVFNTVYLLNWYFKQQSCSVDFTGHWKKGAMTWCSLTYRPQSEKLTPSSRECSFYTSSIYSPWKAKQKNYQGQVLKIVMLPGKPGLKPILNNCCVLIEFTVLDFTLISSSPILYRWNLTEFYPPFFLLQTSAEDRSLGNIFWKQDC